VPRDSGTVPGDASREDKPPLSRRFRRRKGELLPLVQRFFEHGSLIAPAPEHRGKHYGKRLAAELQTELHYRLWNGHRNDAYTGAIYSELHLNRASELLLRRRWQLFPYQAETRDRARQALTAVLHEPYPDRWDPEIQAWVVHPKRAERIETLLAEHPVLDRKLFTDADRMLRSEHKRRTAAGHRLEREMSEGQLPLHEQLRRMVHQWRKRGISGLEWPG
jgi:hypothetical protein